LTLFVAVFRLSRFFFTSQLRERSLDHDSDIEWPPKPPPGFRPTSFDCYGSFAAAAPPPSAAEEVAAAERAADAGGDGPAEGAAAGDAPSAASAAAGPTLEELLGRAAHAGQKLFEEYRVDFPKPDK
jgi:hypothetical protein